MKCYTYDQRRHVTKNFNEEEIFKPVGKITEKKEDLVKK
jgi:hypothetical protein